MSITIKHVATIQAYERAEDHGGGFRATYTNRETGEHIESEVFDSLDKARCWAKKLAHDRHKAEGYKLGLYRPRAGYRANIWCNRSAAVQS